MPARSGFAYVFALFTPYAGRAGGAAGAVIVLAALIGVIAAVAVPAYVDYTARAKLTLGFVESEPARRAIAAYYAEKKEMPPSLDEDGVAPTLGSGTQLALDPDTQALTVDTAAGQLVFLPQQETEGGPIVWQCAAGDGVKAAQLPRACGEACRRADPAAPAPTTDGRAARRRRPAGDRARPVAR